MRHFFLLTALLLAGCSSQPEERASQDMRTYDVEEAAPAQVAPPPTASTPMSRGANANADQAPVTLPDGYPVAL